MRSFLQDAVNQAGRRPAVPDAARAALFPEFAGGPALRLAEGVLRAPWRGSRRPPILSACIDESRAAELPPPVPAAGRVLVQRGWENEALIERAAAARRRLVETRAGGEWWLSGSPEQLPESGFALVALVEPALAGGRAPAAAAVAAMLDAALAEHRPDRLVVLAPARPGPRLHARLAAFRRSGGAVVAHACDPWPLLDRAGRLYSAGGETGFLGLLAGVPVRAFAPALYTGWGVTEDAAPVPQHPFRRTLDEIFAGICLLATRCRDPFRGIASRFEDVLETVAEWRRLDQANRGIAVCIGMSFWKRRRIVEFVRSSAGPPEFRRTVAAALAAARPGPEGERRAIAGWASRLPAGLPEAAARAGVPLIRVEDGFIRSVGLGSDFLPPASLVFDAHGMYFDPRGGSELEILLRDGDFPAGLVARAARLRDMLVSRGITKYNLAAGAPNLDMPGDRRRILVPGQVEDDLSIRFGAGEVRTNLMLLARVRAANPDAFIVYKPHPDVLAGHRVGAVPEAEARRHADAVITDASTDALLLLVDELHTMTSLAGFEALLRGRRVVVYGRPFYAGWGLTSDLPPFERGRRLSLDQLVAGALILYPRYLDPLTRLPCGPEILIERLERPELWRPGPLVLARRLQGALARQIGRVRAMLPARPPVRRMPARWTGLGQRPGERPGA